MYLITRGYCHYFCAMNSEQSLEEEGRGVPWQSHTLLKSQAVSSPSEVAHFLQCKHKRAMTTSRICSTTLLLILAIWPGLHAQQVWPGDVNNNGVVNEVDFLFWGLAYGSVGPARDVTGVDWQPYNLSDAWAQSFTNGINYAFADCNGDGIVDEEDYEEAIEDNFLLQHGTLTPDGYSNASSGSSAPKLRLQPSALAVQEGATVDFNFSIDDSQMPLDSFYGIALSISYSVGLLEDDDGPDFDLEDDNWIAEDGTYVPYLYHETGSQGQAMLAITRTNQMAVPVQEGSIGKFSIVIEDIIVGLEIDTFRIWIDSVKLITPSLATIAVVPDTASVIVAKDLGMITSTATTTAATVRLFPNPADNEVFIQADTPLLNPVLMDKLGQKYPVELQDLGQQRYRIDCTHLAPGLYWLWAGHGTGTIVEKITVFH